jgi:hypothetical protein
MLIEAREPSALTMQTTASFFLCIGASIYLVSLPIGL